MVFGFFSRKSTTITPPQPEVEQEQVAGPTSSTSAPFVFPKATEQRQLHTPAPSISFSVPSSAPVEWAGSPPPMPPPHTPSPPLAENEPSAEPPVTDPRTLYALIKSVPPQTLHTYCLKLLDPVTFDDVVGVPKPSPKRRRKKSMVNAEDALAATSAKPPLKPHPLLTPPTLGALTAFFNTLVPPPQLHCVRCHKHYFELENTDWSCRVPHDDDSAIVDRVGTKITEEEDEEPSGSEYEGSDEEGKRIRRPAQTQQKSSIYETLWGCCGQTVEGDGDQGPPDGWCYEGRHTTDHKRARFRADSAPHDDKLVSCDKLKCFRPPVSQGSTASPSLRSFSVRKRKRSTRASVDYRELEDEDEMEEDNKGKDDEEDKKSVASVKRRRKDSTSKEKGKGTGKPRKRVVKSKEEVDDEDDEGQDANAMDVDQPSTSVPRSPPASPRRKPVSSASTSSTPAATKRKGRAKPAGLPSPPSTSTNASTRMNNKPAQPSPLGARQNTTIIDPSEEKAGTSSGSHRRSRSRVFVEITASAPGSRRGSVSPFRGGGRKSTSPVRGQGVDGAQHEHLTRHALNKLKAKGSVATLRDKFEKGAETDGEERGRKAASAVSRQRRKALEEVVGSSVDNEVEMH